MLGNYAYIQAILVCIRVRLDHMIMQHCKVLFVRIDIRFPVKTIHQGNNFEISQFMKELMRFYKDNGIDIHYVWAREQLSSDAPHYHIMLLLNGSRLQDAMGVWAKASEIWSRITNGPNALVHLSGSVMIRRPAEMGRGHDPVMQQQAYEGAYATALERASYLAKTYSKGNAPFRARQYDASRL